MNLISKKEYNEMPGEIISDIDPTSGRYDVRLENGTCIKIKAANMEKLISNQKINSQSNE